MRQAKIVLSEYALRKLLCVPDGMRIDYVYAEPDPPRVCVVLSCAPEDDRLPRRVENAETVIIPGAEWMSWSVPPADDDGQEQPELPGFRLPSAGMAAAYERGGGHG